MSQTKAQLIDPTDGSIVNADINASAAIAGSKISPDFGSQTISTTGTTNLGNTFFSGGADGTLGKLTLALGNASNKIATIQGTSSSTNEKGIAFKTFSFNAKDALTLTPAGFVGINTTSPVSELHVMDGDLFLTDNSTATNSGQAVYFQSTTNGWTKNAAHCVIHGLRGDNSSGIIRFDTRKDSATNERMRIDASGRVLIGTTTEGHASADNLTIASSASTGITIRSGTSSEGNIFFSDGTSGASEYAGFITYDHSNNSLRFTTNASERMRIDSSGQVGMGTTSPAQQAGRGLHIHGTDQARIKLTNATSGATANDGFDIIQESDMDIHILNHENMAMKFGTNDAEKMRITSDGNLAIGDTTANRRLQVTNGTTAGTNLQLKSTNDSAGLQCVPSSGDTFEYQAASVGLYVAYNRTDNRTDLFVDGIGRVFTGGPTSNQAVGTSAQFQVSFSKQTEFGILCRHNDNNTGGGGPMIFQNVNGGSIGSISSTGSIVAYNTSSDYRLKENVVAISDGITRLKTLKPSRFNWIIDETNTPVDGFLAHEVTSAVPEAVTGEKDAVNEDNSIKPQQIDQAKLVPLLTAALQEAVTKIETLETKVAALEAA